MGVQKNKPSQQRKKGNVNKNKNKKYDNKAKTIKVVKDDEGKLQEEKKLTGESEQNKEKQQKEKILNKKKRLEKQQEEDHIEHFDKEGFFILPDNMQVSQADEDILKQFAPENMNFDLNEVQNNFEESLQQQKQQEYKENILNNPKIKVVYSDVGKLMKTYRSGKLARAFKVIPMIEQWEDVLKLTRPEDWSPQGMYAATRCLASNLDPFRAKIYFEKYLLPAMRKDIKKHKKLNYHYYQALQKATYKPAAWFKGILFTLLQQEDFTLKEAQIVGSVLQKISIPSVHSSVAILKLSQFSYTGPTGIILRVLIEKKYALPIRVINSLIQFFLKFTNDERQMPVIWQQLFLRFSQLYSANFDAQSKSSLKKLANNKFHYQITPEILKALDGQYQQQEQEKMALE